MSLKKVRELTEDGTAGFTHWADFAVRLSAWMTAHVDKSLCNILKVGGKTAQYLSQLFLEILPLLKREEKKPLALKERTENENSKNCVIGVVCCSLSFL